MADSLSLTIAQHNDIQEMRNQLLSFDKKDSQAARKAVQNITILRFYHQLERIVRYTELIDHIEDRMYQSIELKLQNSDPDDEELWFTLIPMQERLQRMMIESHKLLEPYLSPELLAPLEVPKEEDPAKSFTSMILDQESREKVRTGVQQLMEVINTFDSTATEANTTQVQAKAQEALANLEIQETIEEETN